MFSFLAPDEPKIQIPAILIANAMGIAILFVVAVGNFWRIKDNNGENKSLVIMFLSCLVSCIADPICFLADGHSGLFNYILVVGCNSLLYLGGITISIAWISLVSNRLKIKLSKIHVIVIYTFFCVVALLIVVNLFVPVIFSVDENNVYHRLGGYWVYISSYFAFILDGLVLYFYQRHQSGGLKFFPVWAFIIPAGIGIAVQTIWYGISTSTPFITVSLVCVILCMQNEYMSRDKLTGLYNRFYLNSIENKMLRFTNLKCSAIMLDINGFKKINDTYGHKVGDEALIKMASVLTETVGKIGEVVRYAGDEFIIIVNTQDDARLEKVISNIHKALDVLNKDESVPYELSVSTGYSKLDFKEHSMDEYMDKIDKLMYENKQEHYELYTRYTRNKTSEEK